MIFSAFSPTLLNNVQMVHAVENGPRSAAYAERFYKTLQRFAIAVKDDAVDPWNAIPDAVTEHKDVIEKMIAWRPEHREEVTAYLQKAVLLVGQREKPRLTLVHSSR